MLPGARRLGDGVVDAFGVGQHLIVPEAEDAVALGFEEPGSRRRVESVLAAVELDHQMLFETYEIDDVGTDGMLAAEFDAVQLTRAQQAPERLFGIGGIASKLFRSVIRHGEMVHDSPGPGIPLTLPPLRGGPLPLPQGARENKARPKAPLPLGERGWGEGFTKKNPTPTRRPDA